MFLLSAFILGLICAPLVPQSLVGPPALLAGVAAALLLAGSAVRSANNSTKHLRFCILWCGYLLLGAAVALAGVERVVGSQIGEDWHGQDILLQGTVVEVIDQSRKFSRFIFEIDQLQPAEALPHKVLPHQVRLSWYYGKSVAVGEVWQLKARLKPPRGFVNPRGFDYAAWLLTQGVTASGYVKEGRLATVEHNDRPLATIREQLAARLFAGDLDSAPFFRALLLGDKSDISTEQWRVLQRTGTIHLMAISGLHVGLVAVLGFGVGWYATRVASTVSAVGRLRLYCWFPPLCSCAFALCYSAIAGFSIPTQRAMLVIGLANVALVLGLRVRPVYLLALACLVVLLLSPLAPTQNGFWLSFGAVAVLLLGFGGRVAGAPSWLALSKAQALVSVGLIPPLLALGAVISLVGPAANLVAVPVVSLLIVPGLLLAAVVIGVAPALASMVTALLDTVFQLLLAYLSWLSDVSWAQWWPSVRTSNGVVIALAVGALFVLMPRGLGVRVLGVLIVGLTLLAPRPPEFGLKLTLVEVGQGLAVWVSAPGYNLLFDTGPGFSPDFDAGSRIVAPYLRSEGVKKLDTVIVSHGDNDHVGGLAGILREMPVTELLTSQPVASEIELEAKPCEQGTRWIRSGVKFSILWPSTGGWGDNDGSCVLLVEWGKHKILLTGDIEAKAERALLASDQLPSGISVLVAPHHGSRTSSTAAFVRHLGAEVVVFSAGYKNRYRHPHPDVVERYRQTGTMLLNTGEDGAVTFIWKDADSAPNVALARRDGDRVWY
jgi:competence protein ComEC